MKVSEQGRSLVSQPKCSLACGGTRVGKAGGRGCWSEKQLQWCRGVGNEPWAEAGAGEMGLGRGEIAKRLSRKDA